MSEFSVNKNNQVAGNRAFIIGKDGRGREVYAHHMFCRKCGKSYHQTQYATGRARCPHCMDGIQAQIPAGATMLASQIPKTTDAGEPWKLVKTEPNGSDAHHDQAGASKTEEDAGSDNDEPVWTPADIFMEDEGLTIAETEKEDHVVGAEDVEVAAELARTKVLTGLGAKFKPWEETREANRDLWRDMVIETVAIFGVTVEDADQGEQDETA